MVQQIFSTGLRLNFSGKVPAKYKEKNNKSFEANIQFGIDKVKKLLSYGFIEEVDKDMVVCINPMSMSTSCECFLHG